jgi:hypothetical protein
MGNTKRSERHRLPVYFTDVEKAQLDAILKGRNFNRWVREQVKLEAEREGLPFADDLPETGKYKRKD